VLIKLEIPVFCMKFWSSDNDVAAVEIIQDLREGVSCFLRNSRDSTIISKPCGLHSLTHPFENSPTRTLEVYRIQICIFHPSYYYAIFYPDFCVYLYSASKV